MLQQFVELRFKQTLNSLNVKPQALSSKILRTLRLKFTSNFLEFPLVEVLEAKYKLTLARRNLVCLRLPSSSFRLSVNILLFKSDNAVLVHFSPGNSWVVDSTSHVRWLYSLLGDSNQTSVRREDPKCGQPQLSSGQQLLPLPRKAF